jgi:hypothetical protein
MSATPICEKFTRLSDSSSVRFATPSLHLSRAVDRRAAASGPKSGVHCRSMTHHLGRLTTHHSPLTRLRWSLPASVIWQWQAEKSPAIPNNANAGFCCITEPSCTPSMRLQRNHSEFLTNLPAPSRELQSRLLAAWDATTPFDSWPREVVRQLAEEKYSRPKWIRRR